ncbi:MAG TPA: right-handed parallel beta-helix repeat-containing protein [Bryobacteraceae bacterium]|nr:right-handed parallel beta-helix repeat-containing protein [Bryobacteraceae bacterium]
MRCSPILVFIPFLAVRLWAADGVVSKTLYTEPPTLVSLGFEWQIDGDDNRNASVAVSYRKKGETPWKQGLPFLRVGNEVLNENAHQFVTPNMLAGSIFDLEPGVEYECRFVLSDPDGVSGAREQTATVRTRPEPQPARGGKVYHVYPADFKGTKQEPAFTGLMAAYNMGGNHSDNFNSFPPRVQPGDIILVHAGLYKDDRFKYGGGGPGGTGPSDGTYYLTQSGTPDRPIVIKAAGDGEPIFDGDGAYNLFNVMAANYNYFEGLTIRNTDIAFLAGIKHIAGASGITIRRCHIENVGRVFLSDWSGSKDFYIADNVMVGRFPADHLMGFTGRTWQKYGDPPKLVSEYAVKVYGSGHAVAYNTISNFHDGVDVATYGPPDGAPNPIRDRLPVSIDFYNNDISNMEDNCIESDGGAYNIRVFRNRCFNHGHRALSVQPVFGGPVYFIRNIVYHAPEGGAVKLTATSSGIVFYHNTLIAPVKPMLGAISNVHFRNNLILGRSETSETFAVETYTNYSNSDYNGFRPNEGADFSFEWISPPFGVMSRYAAKPNLPPAERMRQEAGSKEDRKFRTLREFSEVTGQDRHSILVDYDVFKKVTPPNPDDPRILYKPADFDFELRPNSVAVDAGVVLPNVNDGFTGKAPDLGAYESGLPLPHYGVRN